MRGARQTGLLAALIVLAAAGTAGAHVGPPHPPATLPEPTPVAAPAPAVAPGAKPRTLRERIQSLYSDFRNLKAQLPFKVGAGIYLYLYQPLDSAAVQSYGSHTTYFELWSIYVEIDKEYKGFGGHLEFRVRDKAALRVSSLDNVWLQLAYAYYQPIPEFRLRAGKLYKATGMLWDDTFYGNIPYYDGMKLNPDWGVGADGTASVADDKVAINWFAQYFFRSDDVQGAYTDQRVLETSTWAAGDPRFARRRSPAPESERDSAGNPMTTVEKSVVGRLEVSVQPRDWLRAGVGGGGETGLITRRSAVDGIDDPDARYYRAGADLNLQLGPVGLIGEYLHQGGDGARIADYVIGGIKGTWKTLTLRLNGNWVRYELSPEVRMQEYLILPGVTWVVGGGLTLYAEYAEWQRKDPQRDGGFFPYDRSFNFSIEYIY